MEQVNPPYLSGREVHRLHISLYHRSRQQTVTIFFGAMGKSVLFYYLTICYYDKFINT